jgi:hypothetical protein
MQERSHISLTSANCFPDARFVPVVNYKGAAGIKKIRQTLTAGRPSVPALPIGVHAADVAAFRDAVVYLIQFLIVAILATHVLEELLLLY